MKAWIVYCGDEWCALMHAPTTGKARAMAQCISGDDYISFRARRFPELDNRPFTWDDCKNAGFEYMDDNVPIGKDEFINDCKCAICKGG